MEDAAGRGGKTVEELGGMKQVWEEGRKNRDKATR